MGATYAPPHAGDKRIDSERQTIQTVLPVDVHTVNDSQKQSRSRDADISLQRKKTDKYKKFDAINFKFGAIANDERLNSET